MKAPVLWLGLSCSSLLSSCSSGPSVHWRSVPYVALSEGLRYASRYADDRGRIRRPNLPLLSFGDLEITTAWRVRRPSGNDEPNESGADGAAGSGSERRWRFALRASRKEVYFEVQFRF